MTGCVAVMSGINSASDLARQDQYDYGTVEGSQTETFFRHTRMEDYAKMWAHMSTLSPGSIVKRVEHGFEVSTLTSDGGSVEVSTMMQDGGSVEVSTVTQNGGSVEVSTVTQNGSSVEVSTVTQNGGKVEVSTVTQNGGSVEVSTVMRDGGSVEVSVVIGDKV